jgi:hypothetical protein
LIPNKYYIASVLLAHTNGLNEMMKSVRELNLDKLAWMEHAQMLHENINYRTSSTSGNLIQSQIDQQFAFFEAQQKTGRAIAAGIALAAIDGPLPVMDVIGFGIATTGAALAWYDYFTTS